MDDIERMAGRVVVAGYPDAAPPRAILEALAEDALGGVILFSRNVAAPIETARRVAQVAAAASRTPLVAIDQEGGRVQRLKEPVLQLPPMRELGERDDPELTRAAGAALGRQLAAFGFNVDFAPVLDIDTNPENRVIGDRSFGDDPERVARHGVAFARGLADAGILSCGKHFPGHGDTVEDSHFELPALPHDMERLERVELVPFRAAVGEVASIMTAHIVFRALDPDRPATLSRAVIQGLLRDTLGYRGLVVSDDLEMRAIADHYAVGGAAVAAIRAGCDVVLVCKTPERVREACDSLAAAAREDEAFLARLSEAVDRVDTVRAGLRCEPIVDEGDLRAALAASDAVSLRERLS